MTTTNTALAAILNRLRTTTTTTCLSVEEAKCLQSHLAGIDEIVREAFRQEAEAESRQVAAAAGSKAVTVKVLPVGSTFTVTALGDIKVGTGSAVCTVTGYRIRSRNGSKTREMSFTFTNADGKARTGTIRDPRARDVDIIARP